MMRVVKSRLCTALFLIFAAIGDCVHGSQPPPLCPLEARPIATKARLAAPGSPLYVTIGGKERKIADSAFAVCLIDRGRKVIYSAADGAGGYENEGQALYIYDTQTGEQKKIVSEYFTIERVRDMKTSTARTVLLVKMRDGALGASHLAVVDPARGEVLYKGDAEVIGHRGDTIVVGYYRDEDWDRRHYKTVHPYKTEHFDLNKLLQMPVIANKPTGSEGAAGPNRLRK